MEQSTLFRFTQAGAVPAIRPEQADDSLDARFARFLVECPDVYPEFVQIAKDLRTAGRERYSADAICHVIRYFRDTRGASDGFKVNNDYTSRLARKAMAEHPELAGFFETRELKSKQ